MRNILKGSILAITLAATPLLSLASQSPQNEKQMAGLQYLVGTWQCDWTAGSNSGSERQVFAPVFDGAWLEEKEIVNEAGRSTVHSIHYTGYDPAMKMFVHVGPDAGGSYELAQSPDAIYWRSSDGSFEHRKVSDTRRTMNESVSGKTLSMTCTKI